MKDMFYSLKLWDLQIFCPWEVWWETSSRCDREVPGPCRERTLFLLRSSTPTAADALSFLSVSRVFLKWPCLKQDVTLHRYRHTAIIPTWHTTLACDMRLSNHNTAWIFGSSWCWHNENTRHETSYHQYFFFFFLKLPAGAFLPRTNDWCAKF